MTKSLMITTILTVFSTPAFAQSGGFEGFGSLLPLILVCAVYYFIWKRQRKRAKKSAELLERSAADFAELLEQRFIDIENRIDSIERSQG